jgi:hypothetical protein
MLGACGEQPVVKVRVALQDRSGAQPDQKQR